VKDWFLEVSRCLVDGNLGLFIAVDGQDDVYRIDERAVHLHPPDKLRAYYRFVGRVLGKAISDRHVIDVRLDRTILLHILGQKVDMEDVRGLDAHRYRGFKWMLDNDITNVLEETFSVSFDVLGEMVTVDLREGGQAQAVTESNKTEYVEHMVHFMAYGSVRQQVDALTQGVWDVVNLQILQQADLDADDLETLFVGTESIDVMAIEAVAKYTGGYTEETPVVRMFWKVFRAFDASSQRRLLRFVTGLHKVPFDGFDPPFTVMRSTHEGGVDSYPRSHTCFNQLALPEYTNQTDLREKIEFALENASSAFLIA